MRASQRAETQVNHIRAVSRVRIAVGIDSKCERFRQDPGVTDAVLIELKPIQERAAEYAADPTLVKNIVADGCEKARKMARETMRDVREAMGLGYN